MPPQINISELYSLQKKKKQQRTVCFDKILELCHNRIKSIAAISGQNVFYEIPGFLIGYPLYDLQECLDYIVDALRKNGFLIQILPKPHIAVIYISWDPEELKPPKPIKLLRPRAQAHAQITDRSESNENLSNSTLSLIKKNHIPDYIIPNPKAMPPVPANTRPVRNESFYLSKLRLF